MNGDPRTRRCLRWSFQWKELVISRNDAKPFREVIKINTGFNIEVCRAEYPIIFSEVPDLIM